ncbi:MAG: GatB/YqeY domain-containing protein [Geobacter sp.]|nr:GatB/YqeY domain-containing protein [Geobacter sp.]
MSLRARLSEEMKSAMKARDSLKLSSIRLILSAVRNKEIDQKKELDDQGIVEVIASLVKQRKESIKVYSDAGRADLAEKEERELFCLLEFLPQQLTEDEIGELVLQAIAETGAQGAKDMGKVMKALKSKVAGRADGRLVNEIVRQKLA